MDKIKTLFFSASPVGSSGLMVEEEIRAITKKIRAGVYRDSIELVTALAARPDDLIEMLNQHKPQIVHFSAHGKPTGEILLLDKVGGLPKAVESHAIRELFKTMKDNIRVVVLNACYSKEQARAIVKVIDCAIGINIPITNQAAIAFAASFYRALGFGRSVEEAYGQGRAAILLEGIDKKNIPELLVKEGVDPSRIFPLLEEKGTVSHDAAPHPEGNEIRQSNFMAGLAKIIRDALKRHYKEPHSSQAPDECSLVRKYLEDLKIRLKEDSREDRGSRVSLEAVETASGKDTGVRNERKVIFNTIKRRIRMILAMSRGGDGATARLAHLDRKSKIVKDIFKHLLSSHEPVVLLGDPGTGKSVALRETGYLLAEKEVKSNHPMLTVFIKLDEVNFGNLKKLDKNDVKEVVKNKLPENLKTHFEKFLREKRLIVIFDGMDEMNRSQYKEYVHALSNFANHYKDRIKTLFSCRINDFSEEFEHRQLALLPFNRKQIIQYFEKNLAGIVIEGEIWRPKKIMKHLEKDPLFSRQMSNPYFLRTFVVYLKEEIKWPDSIVDVYNVFLLSHYRELEKKQDKEKLLGIDEAFNGWAYIAYLISSQNQGSQIADQKLQQEFPNKKLNQLIDDGVNCHILKKILIDKDYYIAFAHHRYQEYFTARYLKDFHTELKENSEELNWLNLLNVPHWQETFLILATMDSNFPGVKGLAQSIRNADYALVDKRETRNVSSELKVKNEEEERLMAERVLLASQVVKRTSKEPGSAGKTLWNSLIKAIKVLADRGQNTTQIMMLWACNYLEETNIDDLIRVPLESDTKFVRGEALLLASKATVFGRNFGPSLTFEVCKEMASERLLVQLPMFIKTLFANFSVRNLWSIFFATFCSLLTPAVMLWSVYVSYNFLKNGNILFYLNVPQVEIVFWVVTIAVPIFLYSNDEYNYNVSQSILATGFGLLIVLMAAKMLEKEGFWEAFGILVALFLLGAVVFKLCTIIILLLHSLAVLLCMGGTWPWCGSKAPSSAIISLAFTTSKVGIFIQKYLGATIGAIGLTALFGLIAYFTKVAEFLEGFMNKLFHFSVYAMILMLACAIIFLFLRGPYLIFKKIKQHGIKNIPKLILGKIQKSFRAIFSHNGFKKIGFGLLVFLGAAVLCVVIFWGIPSLFIAKGIGSTPIGVLLLLSVPFGILIYIAFKSLQKIIPSNLDKYKKLSDKIGEWENDFALADSPKHQELLLYQMEEESHFFKSDDDAYTFYKELLKIKPYIIKEPAKTKHTRMLLSCQQEKRFLGYREQSYSRRELKK